VKLENITAKNLQSSNFGADKKDIPENCLRREANRQQLSDRLVQEGYNVYLDMKIDKYNGNMKQTIQSPQFSEILQQLHPCGKRRVPGYQSGKNGSFQQNIL
jgi:hypothetical protein